MTHAKTVLLAIGVLLVPGMSLAQQSPAHEALKRHCTGDYMEHCSAFAPGGPEVEMCFKEKARKLSPDCSSAILAYKQEQKGIKQVSVRR